jgi:glycosyltransferase involved in cell wall biosynthesis
MISIIMPVFNTEKYLEKSIESIINQTYTDWELILIDDGSTDGSGIICDKYARSDKRIKVAHKVNEGPCVARNVALELARGEWISNIDSDDWISPSCYNEIMKTNLESIDLVECNVYEVVGIKQIPANAKYSNDKVLDAKHWKNNLVNSLFRKNKPPRTILIRHDLILKKKAKYNPDFKICEDIDFLFEIIPNLRNVSIFNNRFYYYRIREGSLTNEKGITEKTLSTLLFYEKWLANSKNDECLFHFSRTGYLRRLIILFYYLLRAYCTRKHNDDLLKRYHHVLSKFTLNNEKIFKGSTLRDIVISIRNEIKRKSERIIFMRYAPIKESIILLLIKLLPLELMINQEEY